MAGAWQEAFGQIAQTFGGLALRQLEQRADEAAMAKRQEYAAQQQVAQEKRQAMLKPPQERTFEGVGEDGKPFRRQDTWRVDFDKGTGSWQEGEPVMVTADPSKSREQKVVEGDELATYSVDEFGNRQELGRGPRYRPDAGRAPQPAPAPTEPRKFIARGLDGRERWIAEGEQPGPGETVLNPGTAPSRRGGRYGGSGDDNPGFLDRLAGAAETFAASASDYSRGQQQQDKGAAAAPADKAGESEQPVEIKTDKNGKKWKIYADGTMEPA